MRLSPHFFLHEFTDSKHSALGNAPGGREVAELAKLAQFMEEVRSVLGNHPITITSGYRSQAVNLAVGGANNSAHLFCRAADFICPEFGSPLEICRAIVDSGLEFDQLINEPSWVHIGISERPRLEAMTRIGHRRYVSGLHDLRYLRNANA